MSMSAEDLAARIKQRFPEYQAADDQDLASRWVQKHPEYAPGLVPIDRHAAQQGVPIRLVRAMAGAEGTPSGITSAVGAQGVLQVMPDQHGGHTRTIQGTTYNLQDKDQSIAAGVHYIKTLADEFGLDNPDQIAAAYHAGPGAVRNAMANGKRLPHTEDRTVSAARGRPFFTDVDYVPRFMERYGPSGTGPIVRGDYAARAQQAMSLPDTGSPIVPQVPGTQPAVPPAQRVTLTTNDTAWHFGMSPSEAKKLTPRAIQVLQEAVASDAAKKAAGQPIYRPPLKYQNEMRARAGLKPLVYNIKTDDSTLAPYYKPEVGALPILNAPSDPLLARMPGYNATTGKVEILPKPFEFRSPTKEQSDAALRAEIQQQVLAERATQTQGQTGQQGRMGFSVSQRANSPTAVADEVERRLSAEKQRQAENERLQKSFTAGDREIQQNTYNDLKSGGPTTQGISMGMSTFGTGFKRLMAGVLETPGMGWRKGPSPLADFFRRQAHAEELGVEQARKEMDPSRTRDVAEFISGTAGSVADAALVNTLLGPIAGFGALEGFGSLGRNEGTAAALGQTLKGAAIGGVFKGAPFLESPGEAGTKVLSQRITDLAKSSAGIATGTFAVEKAAGASDEDAARAAWSNTLFHLSGAVPEAAERMARASGVTLPGRVPTGPSVPEGAQNKLNLADRLRQAQADYRASLPTIPIPERPIKPYIGDLRFAGMTDDHLQELIAARVKKGTPKATREAFAGRQIAARAELARRQGEGPLVPVEPRESGIQAQEGDVPSFQDFVENYPRGGVKFDTLTPNDPLFKERAEEYVQLYGGKPNAVNQRKIQGRDQTELRGVRSGANVPQYPSEVGNQSGRSPTGRSSLEKGGKEQEGLDPSSGGSGLVQSAVLPPLNDLKVLQSIVASMPVDVVNNLGGQQRAAEMLFHDPAMLKNLLATHSDSDVITFAASLEGPIADLRTKLTNGQAAWGDKELLTTLNTLKSHLIGTDGPFTADSNQSGTLTVNVPPATATQGAETSRVPPVGQNIETGATNLAGQGDHGETVSQQTDSGNRQYQHLYFGLVTEDAVQSGVKRDRVRVIAEDGSTHTIKRVNLKGIGNNVAIPVRQPTVPTPPESASAITALPNGQFQVVADTPTGRVRQTFDTRQQAQAAIVDPHPDTVVEQTSRQVVQSAATRDLSGLSSALESLQPEDRARLQGLAAEIAKEKGDGQTTVPLSGSIPSGSEASAEVPRPDQGAQAGPTVPAEPGASGAAGAQGSPLSSWGDVASEVRKRLNEVGPILTGGMSVYDPAKYPKGGLPDHAKLAHVLEPVLIKLKADASSLIAAGKLRAEDAADYIRQGVKDLFEKDPYFSAWNPINKRASTAIVARESTPPSTAMNAIARVVRNAHDFVSIESIPNLSRAGVAGEARAHASARIATPFVVRDVLSQVFPEQYADPEGMSKTIDVINKDNILGGYDTFMRRGMDAQVKAATAEATEKAAIKQRKDLDKNPPAGLTPKEVGALKAAANNAVNAAHTEAIGSRREASGWIERASQVGDKQDIAQLEADVTAAQSDPQIIANIERWKQVVNPELDRLYNEAKRIDPNTPQSGRGRVFGARINLLPETRAEEMKAFSDPNQPMPQAVTSNYRNPNVKRDPFMRAAKFTGAYSTDAQAVLTNVLGPRLNEVTKLRLFDALVARGAGVELAGSEKPPDLIQGQKPVRLAIKVPQTTDSGTTMMVERNLWVRSDLAEEVRNVLNTDMRSSPHPLARFLTQVQLAQLTDMTAHLKNIHTILAAAPATRSIWLDAIRRLPILGSVDSVGRIVNVTRQIMSDSPEIRSELSEMAQRGLIRPNYPPSGIQKILRGQQFIHKVDTASRVTMNRFFDNLVARGSVADTPENRASFVQQVGEYNSRLMGDWMRRMRDKGLSPFVVAGRNFNRQAVRLLTGHPGVEAIDNTEAAKMRAVNIATGLVAASVLPAILNVVTTGGLGGRPGTPIGAWDIGRPADDKGKHRVIDLFQMMGIRRGLRATGLNALIEGSRGGASANDMVGDAISDVVSAQAHPWLGPALGFTYQALTGKRLDLRGGAHPSVAKNVGGGAAQYAENMRTALETQNPLLYSLISPLTGAPSGQEGDSFATRLRKGVTKGPASAFGVTDVQSPAMQDLNEKLMATMPQVPTSGPRQTVSKAVIAKERSGQPAQAELLQGKQEGVLNAKDVQRLVKAGKLSPMQAKVESLNRDSGLVSVLDWFESYGAYLTPDERVDVQKILRRSKINLAEHPENMRGTVSEKSALKARLNAALGLSSVSPMVPAQP